MGEVHAMNLVEQKRKVSLQQPYNDLILTSGELFLYAKWTILGINFEYTMIKDYEESEHHLTPRF